MTIDREDCQWGHERKTAKKVMWRVRCTVATKSEFFSSLNDRHQSHQSCGDALPKPCGLYGSEW